MENITKMAGEFASHAIWSISSGETLIPILGYLRSDKSHLMQRLAMGSVEAVEIGERKISQLDADTLGATFIKDGFITLDTGKTDALIVDVRFSDNTDKKIQFILPYRNANHPDGFAVHRLKVTELNGISEDVMDSLTNAFFDGLESHKEGRDIWRNKYVDQAGISSGASGEEDTEFSLEDFEFLKQSPFLIFFLVAAADGKVDKKELLAFVKIISDPEVISNRLLCRIITNVIHDAQSIVSSMAQKKIDYIEALGKLKNITESNLSPNDANDFKFSLLALGKHIAEASGGFLGFGSKISKEEKAALAAIVVCLEINT